MQAGNQCGNVDCGQMAAWYVFSALGFYPVNPDSGIYAIGSPVVEKAVLHLDRDKYHGKTFTIAARSDCALFKRPSAEFAPDPALDPLWISYWEPFHGAIKKDFGFQITLRVAPD